MIGHKIVRKKLDELKASPYNPRLISDGALEALAHSMKEYGLVQPIIWNQRTGYIVGGHQRVKALQRLGEEQADVIVVDLDPVQEKALNVSLNKISGEWDYSLLPDLLKELQVSQIDLGKLGFTPDELSTLLGTLDGEIGQTPEEKLVTFQNTAIRQIVLYFEKEQYEEVLRRCQPLMKEKALESMSDVFVYLLNAHDNAAR